MLRFFFSCLFAFSLGALAAAADLIHAIPPAPGEIFAPPADRRKLAKNPKAKVPAARAAAFLAARQGKVDRLARAFEASNGQALEWRDPEGKTLLSLAASFGRLAAVEWLVEQGADLDAKDDRGATPLHLAVSRGSVKVVRFLVAQGADPEIRRRDGDRPIDVARRWRLDKITAALQVADSSGDSAGDSGGDQTSTVKSR